MSKPLVLNSSVTRNLASEKSASGGGGGLKVQTKLKRFKDCKQTTVKNSLKIKANLDGVIAKHFCPLPSQGNPCLYLYHPGLQFKVYIGKAFTFFRISR